MSIGDAYMEKALGVLDEMAAEPPAFGLPPAAFTLSVEQRVSHWHITNAAPDSDEMTALLEDGWEPFAVSSYCNVWLRRYR